MDSPFAPSSSSSSSSSSGATSTTMVIITVVGILAAFALLASYYAFVTKCQLLRALLGSRRPPWQRRQLRREAAAAPSVIRAAAPGEERRGLGLPLIRMLPVVKFTAAGCGGGGVGDAAAPRISVSECAVCLSEFEERERVRLLPNCSHAFHIDCIDTWLQGSARCPFCRSDVTLPCALASAAMVAGPGRSGRRDDGALASSGDSSSIVIEKTESLGDEAIDTRKKRGTDEVALLRRSLSLDSCGDKHLYVSVQELLLASQRQVCDPPVRS
ncbi:hypothetical protein U9M48_006144 [Paspalum notatum var. saurae]|uniref:RING-type E3 ubiquitin transferase n=1 Tax=Paspalum notatum var. saurae TaxID=547442 RepID=A0AAQ3SFZ1_PASNO